MDRISDSGSEGCGSIPHGGTNAHRDHRKGRHCQSRHPDLEITYIIFMKLSYAGVRKSDSCVLHLWSIKRFLQIIATQRISTWLVGVFTHQLYIILLIMKYLQKTPYYITSCTEDSKGDLSPQNRGLVDKVELEARFVHRNAVLVDNGSSEISSWNVLLGGLIRT